MSEVAKVSQRKRPDFEAELRNLDLGIFDDSWFDTMLVEGDEDPAPPATKPRRRRARRAAATMLAEDRSAPAAG